MKFENTYVQGFGPALRGMRNPKNSWNKNDTIVYCDDEWTEKYTGVALGNGNCVYIGPNDLKLAQTLIRAGSEHRKFMRQIMVWVDITAPLYWWKEFDTYKVGTVANSTSTMHKLATTPITRECFESDDYCGSLQVYDKEPYNYDEDMDTVTDNFICFLETIRRRYLNTKDKRYWKELIRWLPDSWLQKRTVSMTYENLLAMCSKGQRRFHKLNEWSGQDLPEVPNFIKWARSLPYAQELIFIDEVSNDDNTTSTN